MRELIDSKVVVAAISESSWDVVSPCSLSVLFVTAGRV